jgi:hypothetical protein
MHYLCLVSKGGSSWWKRLVLMFWVYEQERKELLQICTHNATALNGLVAELHLIDEYVSCLSKNMKVPERKL